MSLNYVKVFADGTSEATLVKPAYGIYEREFAGDNRDTYHNGKWHPVTGGGAIYENDGTDTTEWVENNATLSVDNNTLKVTNNGINGFISRTISNLSVGDKVKVEIDMEQFSAYAKVQVNDSFGNSVYSYQTNAGGVVKHEFTFIVQTTAVSLILFAIGTANGDYARYDNISVYKAEPTLGTPYPTQFTYLSKDGKLAEIEVADGQPVDIHFDKLAPTLVEDTIQANNLVVTDSFDLGQTWQNVTASRLLNITYKNDTGKPIFVSVSITSSSGATAHCVIDGITVFGSGHVSPGDRPSLSLVIPNGSTYLFKLDTQAGILVSWTELR